MTLQENQSRRDFLKTCLAIAGSGLWLNDVHAQGASKRKQTGTEADVLVLGAGMAGITAARTLQQAGKRVIVLEGRNRIGGRVNTDRRMKNLSLDLGASWIQGTENNPLTAIAAANNIKTIATDPDSMDAFFSDGKPFTDRDWNRLERISNQMSRRIATAQEEYPEDTTLQRAVDKILADLEISPADKLLANFALSAEIENEYAADASRLSLYFWDQDGGFGGDDVIFPKGYGQIADFLAQGLDIRLEQIVNRVEYGSSGVKVVTDQGSFSAEQAVVTVPLGVLKKGVITFAPVLPATKQGAIKRLEMGILNKLYLRFPKVFWDPEVHAFGYVDEVKGRWNEWYNFQVYVNEPLLLAFATGIHAERIETMKDEAVVADAMTVLRKIYGSAIPNPTEWIVTRWGQDPFTFGSYSHVPPGARGKDYDLLAEPVGNRLFFAGEATNREHPATVHGAYLSGEREAKRILNQNT
ncbi:MAG: FAD-dependent oxidoreductase [Blastocatellia bacterium]|nr:FAD-dependent oxidoreductase [Blastocatellia bacterium]